MFRIGNVSKVLVTPVNPELVPRRYGIICIHKTRNKDISVYLILISVNPGEIKSPSELRCLKWLLEKDVLKQDVFLIGPPGSLRRSTAMRYLVKETDGCGV